MKIIYNYILAVFFFTFCSANAQLKFETPTPNGSTDIDKSIIHGVLDNGFTYYIKPIDSLAGVKMNLMVKVGSYDESDEEVNFAHAIEHLAFRETKNFAEEKGLAGNTRLLSTLGITRQDLGGMTSGVFTNYYLNAPAKEKSIKTGIIWFSDILYGLDLSKQSVDRERGVLIQEYIANQNDTGETQQKSLKSKLFPWISDRSNFVQHNKNFPHQDLQLFYKKWYRPDRMALSIIGNIQNTEQLISFIKKQFETLRSTKLLNKEKDFKISSFKKRPGFGVVKSQVLTNGSSARYPLEIQLYYEHKLSQKNSRDMSGVEQKISAELLRKVLNRRFKEQENSFSNSSELYSFYRDFAENRDVTEATNIFKVILKADTLMEKEALRKGIGLLKQLKKYGIKESEFLKSKDVLLNEYSVINDNNYTYWRAQINKHFIIGEPLPENKNSLIRKFLKELTLTEINEFTHNFILDMPDDIGVILPVGYNTELISEKFTRKYISEAFQQKVSPYELPKTITQLIPPEEVKRLKIRNFISISDGVLESKEYVLSNGLKLILKPDKNSKVDEIVIRGFSKNGASCFSEEDYYSAVFAPSLVKNSGAGRFDKFELNRFYQNTNSLKTGFDQYINYNEAGLKASVNNEEAEILLQLIYLFLTKPHENQLAYEQWRREQLIFSEAAVNTINNLIVDLNELIEDKTAEPFGAKRVEGLQEVELNRALSIYERLYASPEDFTFIITGNFEKEKLLPLIQRYLGNLPGDSKVECDSQNPVNLGSGPITKYKKLEETENGDIAYYGIGYVKGRDSSDEWKEELKVKVLGKVANGLLSRLRSEEELALYFFSAGGDYNPAMNRYELQFKLNCTEDELLLVQDKTNNIINDIKEGNFSENYLQDKLNDLTSHFDQLEDLPLWNNESLYRYYRYNEPIVSGNEILKFLSTLTVEDIQETANKYFKNKYKYELKSKREEKF